MKYLIIKCDEIGDQWECDANRTPICMTDDCSKYGYGYEVYELKPNNTFKLIKEYEEYLERGIAIFTITEHKGKEKRNVIQKFKNLTRNKITKSQVKRWKKQLHFTETVEYILNDILCCGSYGEDIDGIWTVVGEYEDNLFNNGF